MTSMLPWRGRAARAALLAAALAAAPRPAAAEIGALMTGGPTFFRATDVNRVASDLNFDSLSPGLDGGVVLRFGRLERGWSGQTGVFVFWSRRRHTEDLASIDGLLVRRETAFRLTALGFPATLVYSMRRGGGVLYAGIGAAYYVATVTAESDVSGSNWFPSDGSPASGERSADGPGAHATVGYEYLTRYGALGGGALLRGAKFPVDDARGASDFDVDLSGVSLFLSFSIRQAR
jgi:hypothetical protein